MPLLESPSGIGCAAELSEVESDETEYAAISASESDDGGEPRAGGFVKRHVLHRAAQADAFTDPIDMRKDIQQFYDDLSRFSAPAIADQWLSRAADAVGRCRSVANESRRRRALLPHSVKRVLQNTGPGGANTVALDQELQRIGYTDLVGSRLEEGMPIAGELPLTGLWEEVRSKAPERTVDELRRIGSDFKTLRQRCNAAVEDAVAAEIWRQTRAEVGTHLSKPTPFDWGSADTIHRVLTFRFGVEQASSKGCVKIRCIDDFKASGVNSTVGVPESIHHDHIDSLLETAKAIHRSGHQPVLLKADFKGAYRSIPISPEQVDLAQILVRDTDENMWVTLRQLAHPFGAVAAVYAWERVGGAIVAILRSLGLPVFRYVDDLFAVVPEAAGRAARKVIEDVVAAFGFTLAQDKTEGPAKEMVILGVRLECRSASIRLEPDPRKRQLWIRSITDSLATGIVRRRDAEKLAGRLLFSRCSIFGGVGAAQLRRIYACARSGGTRSMGVHLRRTLEWWAAVLQMAHSNGTSHLIVISRTLFFCILMPRDRAAWATRSTTRKRGFEPGSASVHHLASRTCCCQGERKSRFGKPLRRFGPW